LITSFCKVAFAWIVCGAFALGQGSQLPKYTVATLPAASTQPHYIVQAIDGASSTDCATGGGAQNVACVNVAGVWHALGSVSPTFAGTVTAGTLSSGSIRYDVKTFGAVGDGIADDTAALQLAISSGKPIYLSPGTYNFTTLAMPICPNIVGSGSLSILQHTALTGNGIVFSSPTPSNANIPVCPVTDFVMAQSGTPTSGYAISMGATSGYIQGIQMERVAINAGYYGGLDLENGVWMNWFQAISLSTTVGGTCLYYNTTSPGGDAWISGSSTGVKCDVVFNTSDVTTLDHFKINGSTLKFTGAAPVAGVRIVDPSFESGPTCGVDFGTGAYTPYIDVSFVGGKIDLTTTAFCNTGFPNGGTGPFWSAVGTRIAQVTNIVTGYVIPTSSFTLTTGQTFIWSNQVAFLAGESGNTCINLPLSNGYCNGVEVVASRAMSSLVSAAAGSNATYFMQAISPNTLSTRTASLDFQPGNTLNTTRLCLSVYGSGSNPIFCVIGDAESQMWGPFTLTDTTGVYTNFKVDNSGNATTRNIHTATVVNAVQGYQVNGALAPLNHCLVGNGTNFIDGLCSTGTVTSIGLSIPGSVLYTVSGSPVTGSGTLTMTPNTQAPNTIFAGPATGSTAVAPTFRAMVSADLPSSIAANTSGTAANLSGTPALPNGTTGTTQTALDNSTKLATTAYVDSAAPNAVFAFSTGLLTSLHITTGYAVFYSGPVAATIQYVNAWAADFTCTTNPTMVLYDYTAAQALATITLTSANIIAAGGTINHATIPVNHTLYWEFTAGVCTLFSGGANIEYR